MEEELDKNMKPKLIGETYMKYPTEKSRQKYRYGLFECPYCNKEFEAITSSIKIKNTVSCGCHRAFILTNTNKRTHGLTSNIFYQTWYDMVKRCNNPKRKEYKDYGGRGITVCVEWLDVTIFIAWCESTHPNMEGYTLDRIDNDKGYSPENCRWADASTQALNQRVRKDNKSGVVGVSFNKSKGKWVAYISVNNTRKHIGSFHTIEEAVQARDNYIIENKLPHKLSTDYSRN